MNDLNRFISSTTLAREFVISHLFDAPRTLVWKAWTDPECMAQWWGPMWGRFVYREIQAPERLVFVVSFSDQEGNPCRHFASPTWPLEVMHMLTLAEHEGRTTLTLRVSPINATDEEYETFEAARDDMQQEFSGTWRRLDAYLEDALEIAWSGGEAAWR